MIEDIINNKNNSEKVIRSHFWPQKTGKAVRFREVSEWYLYTKFLPIISRILAVVFGFCSLLVLIGETTLYVKNKKMSLFPLLFEDNYGSVGTQLLCFIPLTYLFSSTYIGLFLLRIKGSYGLYNNNNTDPANLVWSAFFMARMVPPLIINFFYFIKIENTQFSKVMGDMNLLPYFGQIFIYFPLLVIVFALLNALEFYAWLMVKLGVPQLSFSDNFDERRLGEGKSLLAKCNY